MWVFIPVIFLYSLSSLDQLEPVMYHRVGLHSARTVWNATENLVGAGQLRACNNLVFDGRGGGGAMQSGWQDLHISEVNWWLAKVLDVSASTWWVDVVVTATSPRMCTCVLDCVPWQSRGKPWAQFVLWGLQPSYSTPVYNFLGPYWWTLIKFHQDYHMHL